MDPSPTYRPPSSEQVDRYLAEHPPSAPSAVALHGPMVALVGLVVLGLLILQTGTGPIGLLLPWALAGGVMLAVRQRVRRTREVVERLARVQDLALRRSDRQALATLWELIPALTKLGPMYGRSITLMALCLTRVGAHDAAIAALDRLLDRLPKAMSVRAPLLLQRTLAAVHADRITDASETLRQLRGHTDQHAAPSTLQAMHRLAQLMLDARTGHALEALEDESTLRDTLRPLGTDAGFGYATAAHCHWQRVEFHAQTVLDAAQPTDALSPGQAQPYHRSQAQQWWSDATMLIPAEALVRRLPELRDMASSLDASPYPLETPLHDTGDLPA